MLYHVHTVFRRTSSMLLRNGIARMALRWGKSHPVADTTTAVVCLSTMSGRSSVLWRVMPRRMQSLCRAESRLMLVMTSWFCHPAARRRMSTVSMNKLQTNLVSHQADFMFVLLCMCSKIILFSVLYWSHIALFGFSLWGIQFYLFQVFLLQCGELFLI